MRLRRDTPDRGLEGMGEGREGKGGKEQAENPKESIVPLARGLGTSRGFKCNH